MPNLPNSTRYEHLPTSALTPRSRQARKHTTKQIKQIAQSIKQFGFNAPIIIDENYVILAGHARWEAAKVLGLATVPTIQLSSLSDDEKRAYVIADNRLAEHSEWDFEILQDEVQLLLQGDLDFDIDLIGFDAADIDGWNKPPAACKQEVVELPSDGVAVTQAGDLWVVGDHRFLCGNALYPNSYDVLMAGKRAQMVFTDPPYNVEIDGNVSGMGKVKHREFAMASGEMSDPGFTRFLRTSFARMAEVSEPAAIHFICMDWKHVSAIYRAAPARFCC